MSNAQKTLNRSDIAKICEESLTRLIKIRPKDAYKYGIRITSGTSVSGPIVTVNEYGKRQLSSFLGDERAVTCIGARNGQIAKIVHLRKQLTDYPQRICAIDSKDFSPELSVLIKDISPDSVTGTTSFLVKLSEFFYPDVGKNVRVLRLAGEKATPLHISIFRKHFSNARVLMNYSVSEIGPIGWQCINILPNYYHPDPEVKISIINKDENEIGGIIVNKIMPDGIVIENYAIGDVGRFSLEKCQCGEKVTFEHLGRRGYDYIKIAGALVKQDELDRAVPSLMRFMDDYRVEVSEVLENGHIKGKLTLRAFSRAGPPTTGLIEEIASDFSKKLKLTPTRTLSQLVASGDFVPLKVEFSQVTFPVKNKNVKLVQII